MDAEIKVLCFAFIGAFVITTILKPLALWAKLVDEPGGRKKHEGVIPLIGGAAIYITVALSVFLFVEQHLFVRIFLLSGGMIVFMGMLDDRYELSARFRLVGQCLVCSVFVYGLDLQIETFGNICGFGEFETGCLSYPLTVLSLMGVINAFNMLDGMDGLVGTVSLVCFSGLAVLFASNGNQDLQLLSVSFVGAIAAFLIFNLWGNPNSKKIKKIFMGDAGAMFLGLAVGVLVITGSQEPIGAFQPITALWFVLLPMTDMFTIIYRRIRCGKSPMAPDRTHVHHILLRAGLCKKKTLNMILLLQIVFVTFGVMVVQTVVSEVIAFAALLCIVIAYQFLLKHSWKFIRWGSRLIVMIASTLFVAVGISGELIAIHDSLTLVLFVSAFICYFTLIHGRNKGRSYLSILSRQTRMPQSSVTNQS